MEKIKNIMTSILVLVFIWVLSSFVWGYYLWDPFQEHTKHLNIFLYIFLVILVVLQLILSVMHDRYSLRLKVRNLVPFVSKQFGFYSKFIIGAALTLLTTHFLKPHPTLLADFFDGQIAFLLSLVGDKVQSNNGMIFVGSKEVFADFIKTGFFFNLAQFYLISSYILSQGISAKKKAFSIIGAFVISYVFMLLYGAHVASVVPANMYAGVEPFQKFYFDGVIFKYLILFVLYFIVFRGVLNYQKVEFSLKEIKIKGPFVAALLFLTFIFVGFNYFYLGTPNKEKPLIIIDEIHGKWEPVLVPFDEKISGTFGENSYYGLLRYLAKHYDIRVLTDGIIAAEVENKKAISDVAGVETLKLKTITKEALKSSHQKKILIIKCSSEKFLDEEVATILDFVRNGGGLFLIGDHTNVFFMNDHINQVSEAFGINYRDDSVYMVDGGWVITSRKNFKNSLATANLETIVWATNDSLKLSKGASPLVTSPVAAFSEPSDYHNENFFGPGRIQSDNVWGSFVVMATASYGSGKILAFTDSTWFNNYLMFSAGRLDFLNGVVNYLTTERSFDWFLIPFVIIFILTVFYVIKQKIYKKDKMFSIAALLIIIVPAFFMGKVVALKMNEHQLRLPNLPEPKEVVLFDSSKAPFHNVAFGASDQFMAQDSYEDLIFDLPRFGYFSQVIYKSEPITIDMLKRGQTFFVITPRKNYGTFEKLAIKKFVKDGGVLVLVEGANNNNIINTLSKMFGLKFITKPDMNFVYQKSTSCKNPARVDGGTPLFKIGELPVISYVKYFKGIVVAVGDDRILTSANPDYSPNNMLLFTKEFALALLAHNNEEKLKAIDFNKYLNPTVVQGMLFVPLERQKKEAPFYRQRELGHAGHEGHQH